MKNLQVNVRVTEEDKPLVLQVAARLRDQAGFRDQLVRLLADGTDKSMVARIERLEAQVLKLQGGIATSASEPNVFKDPWPKKPGKTP